MNKIVVIGCGNVGMSYIYGLINGCDSVDEIVMVDLNEEKILGEQMDLCHALPFSFNHVLVKVGDYEDCRDASIICITAGIAQSMNDRLNDLEKNNAIFKDIISKVMQYDFSGIFLIASNPLDVMTYLTFHYSGVSSNKVIGSGTSLDTSRLTYLLSERLTINPNSIDAYVLGEHGNSQFVAWSKASIAGQTISDFLTNEEMIELESNVRTAGYEIIKRKGATNYGVGMCLVRITNAILKDENVILPVSNYDEKNDIFISTPCVIGKDGINSRITITLSTEEEQKLIHSITIIKDAIQSVLN